MRQSAGSGDEYATNAMQHYNDRPTYVYMPLAHHKNAKRSTLVTIR